jgi:hypothetical protein
MEAARLLNKEWARRYRGKNEILSALDSFVKFYIRNNKNNGWYSGFSEFASTNNGLESANRILKVY